MASSRQPSTMIRTGEARPPVSAPRSESKEELGAEASWTARASAALNSSSRMSMRCWMACSAPDLVRCFFALGRSRRAAVLSEESICSSYASRSTAMGCAPGEGGCGLEEASGSMNPLAHSGTVWMLNTDRFLAAAIRQTVGLALDAVASQSSFETCTPKPRTCFAGMASCFQRDTTSLPSSCSSWPLKLVPRVNDLLRMSQSPCPTLPFLKRSGAPWTALHTLRPALRPRTPYSAIRAQTSLQSCRRNAVAWSSSSNRTPHETCAPTDLRPGRGSHGRVSTPRRRSKRRSPFFRPRH
mmetsp:Transcript_326/g.1064  ORF Transcript_326/g.1064 Transcript_326/m.1064 type:complete len:298 (-) Transcript_326:221-1114(-)